jgi:hypothetical protein
MGAVTDVSIYAFADEIVGELRNEFDNGTVWLPYGFFVHLREYIVANRETSDIGSHYNDWLGRMIRNGSLLYQCDICGEEEEPGGLDSLPDRWHFGSPDDELWSWEYPDLPEECVCEYCFDDMVDTFVEKCNEENVQSAKHAWNIGLDADEWATIIREAVKRMGLMEDTNEQ